jgi:hypothetical protein
MSQMAPLGYSHTPTPLPPAPRKVKARPGHALAEGCARFMILPHFVVGIGVILALIFQLNWMAFGWYVPGEVTGSHQTTSKKSTSYFIDYRFSVQDQEHTGSQRVSLETMKGYGNIQGLPPEQKAVRVKYFGMGAWNQSGLPDHASGWAFIGFLTLFGAFWNAITWIFVYILWVKPIIIKRLYVHGESVSGKVLSKEIKKGKSASYEVKYEFVDPVTGQQITGQTTTTKADWDGVYPGMPVTVLCSSAKPKWNVAYELGPWELAQD